MRYGLLTAALVLAADQASKWWILNGLHLPELGSVAVLPVLNLTMVWNQVVTFGLLHQDSAYGPWLLAGVALAVVAGLTVWMRRAERPFVACALGAIAGGAVGNIIDRIDRRRRRLHPRPRLRLVLVVFNVADAAIVCGVAALILDGFRPARSRLQAPGLRQ